MTQELSQSLIFFEDKHSYIITSHPNIKLLQELTTKEDRSRLIRRLKETEDRRGNWIGRLEAQKWSTAVLELI